MSESAFRRAMIAYNKRGMAEADGSELGNPEAPLMLHRATEALGTGDPVESLAAEAMVPRDLLVNVVGAAPDPATSPRRLDADLDAGCKSWV